MYVPLGTVALPGSPPQDTAALFFQEKTLGGITYKVFNDRVRSGFKGALVGWQVRQRTEQNGTEVVEMTPYTESTGPRDPGDGFRWASQGQAAGKGVVVVPPGPFLQQPDPVTAQNELMRATTGKIKGIIGDDFAIVRNWAAKGRPGVVLYEPAEGWQNVEGSANGKAAAAADDKTTYIIGGLIAAGALAAAWLLWPR